MEFPHGSKCVMPAFETSLCLDSSTPASLSHPLRVMEALATTGLIISLTGKTAGSRESWCRRRSLHHCLISNTQGKKPAEPVILLKSPAKLKKPWRTQHSTSAAAWDAHTHSSVPRFKSRLPVNAYPGRQQLATQVLGSLPAPWRPGMSLTPGFGLAWPLLLQTFGE